MDYLNGINKQLQYLFPIIGKDEVDSDLRLLTLAKSEADERFKYLTSRVKILSRVGVDPDFFHIMKSPVYLYILSRVIYENNWSNKNNIENRLYCLNKAINGCSIYFKIKLPRVFFLNYASGVVLGDCTYGENFVVYQGVTVGGYRGKVPIIGNNVILMPNVIVSGETVIGDNVVISAGVSVINKIIPPDSIVFNSKDRESEVYMHKLKSSEYMDYFIDEKYCG